SHSEAATGRVSTISRMTVFISLRVRMRYLDEHVFKRCLSQRELAQRPTTRVRQAKNFLAHIRPRFHAQGKNLPLTIDRCGNITDTRNLLQFLSALVCTDLCFDENSTSRPDPAEQVFGCVARLDPALVNNNHATAGHL